MTVVYDPAADWYVDTKLGVVMNYGGYAKVPVPWTDWVTVFLWKPKKIDNKWYWLRKIYVRQRRTGWGDGGINFPVEYQYAIDLFELMQKDYEKV